MAGRTSDKSTAWGAMLRIGDKATLRMILDAVKQCDGNLVHACEALGVPHRTMINWKNQIDDLSLGIDRIRIAAMQRDAKKRAEERAKQEERAAARSKKAAAKKRSKTAAKKRSKKRRAEATA